MTGNEMAVIANPNAPTGMAMSVSDIERIVRANPDRVVVVDEAYVDFGAQSCVGLTKTYENLLVVQTFSKSRSLAGARLGFAVGNSALIGDLETLKFSFNPYNISRTSAAAGIAALGDDAYFQYCNTEIIRVRRATARSLSALGFRVLPSCANFLFAKPPGISGAQYYQALRKNGILVRHFEGKRIADFVRISIGTDRQMQTLVDITKTILREVHA
jgi:histidinol-phosphate aminotransferase